MLKNLILDFDSTLVKVEAWDELAKIVIRDRSESDGIVAKIQDLTNKAMTGRASFEQVLTERFKLLRPSRQQIDKLVEVLRQQVTESVKGQRQWLGQRSGRIWVVSGGLGEFIEPVVVDLGLRQGQVLANRFVYDRSGKIIGFDRNNPLITDQGKAEVIGKLNLAGEVIMVGDGWSDYLVKKLGAASEFWLFTENVVRRELVDKADKVVKSFDEVIKNCIG